MPSNHANSATVAKQAPPRPFPWRCQQCGERTVRLSRTSYDAQVRHDGRLHEFTVSDLELPICSGCGAKVFTDAVDEQINAALREHLVLLSPQQIRQALARIGVSQKELASRLRLAEATVSRWVSATQIQSRSMDTLLRLYFGLPQVRRALEDGELDASFGLSDVADHGPGRLPSPVF